jgi:hypothetical protein
MTKRALTAAVVAMIIGCGGTAAYADSPNVNHFSDSFSGTFTFPAGTACDFRYQEEFTVTSRGTEHFTSTGEFRFARIHSTLVLTHRNLTTGASLSETDHFNEIFRADGSYTATGLLFHLRTPEGKLVVVEAGKFDVSPTGEVTVTPHVSANPGLVNCEALGGHLAD